MGNLSSSPGPRLLLPVIVYGVIFNLPIQLIDSSANQYLISHDLVDQLQIPAISLHHPLSSSEPCSVLSRELPYFILHRMVLTSLLPSSVNKEHFSLYLGFH